MTSMDTIICVIEIKSSEKTNKQQNKQQHLFHNFDTKLV